MDQIKENYVHLTGGFGNQLFQLTALVALSGNRILIVDTVNGVPRSSSNGLPDSSQIDIVGKALCSTEHEFPLLVKKAIGYCLRSNIIPSKLERNLKLPMIARGLTSILITLVLRKFVQVKVSKGVGFDPKLKESSVNTYFIGYFQSYKWFQTIRDHVRIIPSASEFSQELAHFKALGEIEKPLVVHVRLGDYLVEGGFGTLDLKYYQKAIDKALASGDFGSIWLFSDQPELAISRIPNLGNIEIRVMPEFHDSVASTFELMRFGRGYVIGNSTFSWWGAMLSYEENPIVIYPNPWFKSLDSPLELIPPHWLPMETQ